MSLAFTIIFLLISFRFQKSNSRSEIICACETSDNDRECDGWDSKIRVHFCKTKGGCKKMITRKKMNESEILEFHCVPEALWYPEDRPLSCYLNEKFMRFIQIGCCSENFFCNLDLNLTFSTINFFQRNAIFYDATKNQTRSESRRIFANSAGLWFFLVFWCFY